MEENPYKAPETPSAQGPAHPKKRPFNALAWLIAFAIAVPLVLIFIIIRVIVVPFVREWF